MSQTAQDRRPGAMDGNVTPNVCANTLYKENSTASIPPFERAPLPNRATRQDMEDIIAIEVENAIFLKKYDQSAHRNIMGHLMDAQLKQFECGKMSAPDVVYYYISGIIGAEA